MQAKNNSPYKNRQKLQREALQLAAECGWRTIQAKKGDQLIIRR